MKESKSKQGYILVMGIEPMTVGGQYKHELHCTLLHWFYSEASLAQIEALIRPIFAKEQPFNIVSDGRAVFGEESGPLKVSLIARDKTPQSLHEQLVQALKAAKAEYLKPEYIGKGWRPHVTDQGSKTFSVGSKSLIKEIYLIECPNGPETRPIMVRARYVLGDENPA